MSRIEKAIKNNTVIQKIYIVLGTIFFRFIAIFIPIKKNRILFSAMSGKSFEYTSPYHLYLAIKEKYGDSYEYVWAFSNKQKAESYTGKRVKIDSFKYFMNVLGSRVWITDVNIERGLRLKRRKQYYVNTWHGGITKGYPKKRKDYKLTNVDIFCSDGTEYERFFTEHYKVNPSAYLRCGRPREDSIFDYQKNRDLYRNQHGFTDDDYLILYMPTWRENGDDQHLKLDVIVDKLPFIKIIYHAHNLSKSGAGEYKNVFDYSSENNINMLYGMADLLITDYSSCMYDFLLIDKPVLLFARDYDDYSKQRGLAIDFKEMFPRPVCENENDLIKEIEYTRNSFDLEKYKFFLRLAVDIDRNQSATNTVLHKMIDSNVLTHFKK